MPPLTATPSTLAAIHDRPEFQIRKMRFLLTIAFLSFFISKSFAQSGPGQIDTIVQAIDNNTNLLCFRYTDTLHNADQFSTREITFYYNKVKKPDTLKVSALYTDSAALYHSIKVHYYFVGGKPIVKVFSRYGFIKEEKQTIYLVKKSEIKRGDDIPEFAWWTNKQDLEHMYDLYRRFTKNGYHKQLPMCR
jgi:hypothetical protein